MSRRIDTGRSAGLESKSNVDGAIEPYLGRLAKYIPAEIVGLYLATAGVVSNDSSGKPNCSATWIVFGLNAALVPIYFFFATSEGRKPPLWPQIILATIAFPIWVFAIGGPFKCWGWYQGWIASLTLTFTTFIFGMYKPRRGT